MTSTSPACCSTPAPKSRPRIATASRPLSMAALNGSAPMVDLLLDNGADPNAALPGGETVLMTAARTRRARPP